tara:strand:+ start:27376 stop:28218 length:843 start_codon:yes stop_codon:yes gene_type:complete
MSRNTRVPGPINLQTTLKQRRELIGKSEWISIDINDGTWTENDPNSTLVSKSTAAGGMTISLESDRDSDDWTVSAQDCVRWYKPLTTSAGSLMKWEDEFGVEFLVQRMSTTANDENFLVACLSDDPTDQTNQVWAGGKMVNDTNGDIQLRVGGDQDLNLATGPAANIGSTPKCYINCMLQIADDRSSDALEPIGVTGIVLNSDSDALSNMLMNGQNISWNNSNNVYLVIAAGWEASGASSDSSAVWKVWYRVTHSFSKMDPPYVPGGGKHPRGGVYGQQR